MGKFRTSCVSNIILVFLLAPIYETITVRPSLCPTNKIAPHKRVLASGRTFAAYYDLLLNPNTPQRPGPQTQDPLQEQPQEDQPDDCGEIEDYDENDLSSVTHQIRRRRGRAENRFFFGGLFHRPQSLPAYTPPAMDHTTPTVPSFTRPAHFTYRPPYWSGGYFGNNQYMTPTHQEPSDNFKPVHEAADVSEVPQTYRPGLVGGPLGHVVGLSQARPTQPTTVQDEKTRRRLEYLSNLRRTTQPTFYTTRPQRPRKLSNDNSVIGSFLDLLLK